MHPPIWFVAWSRSTPGSPWSGEGWSCGAALMPGWGGAVRVPPPRTFLCSWRSGLAGPGTVLSGGDRKAVLIFMSLLTWAYGPQ